LIDDVLGMGLHYLFLRFGYVVLVQGADVFEEEGAALVVEVFAGQLLLPFTQSRQDLLHKAVLVRSEIGEHDLALFYTIHPLSSLLRIWTVLYFTHLALI